MGSHESSSWETEISNFILFHRKTWSLIVMGLLILLLFYCISEGGDLQKFYKDVNGRQALLVGSSWPMAWSSTGRLRASCISQLYFSIASTVFLRSGCMSQILDCCQTGPNHIPLLQCTLKQFGKIFQYLKRNIYCWI